MGDMAYTCRTLTFFQDRRDPKAKFARENKYGSAKIKNICPKNAIEMMKHMMKHMDEIHDNIAILHISS